MIKAKLFQDVRAEELGGEPSALSTHANSSASSPYTKSVRDRGFELLVISQVA